jgi:hypothetical protein
MGDYPVVEIGGVKIIARKTKTNVLISIVVNPHEPDRRPISGRRV